MNNPTDEHLNAVYRILRYLKMTPGKGLFFERQTKRTLKFFQMLIGLVQLRTEGPPLVTAHMSGEIYLLGEAKSNQLWREVVRKLSSGLWLIAFVKVCGFKGYWGS